MLGDPAESRLTSAGAALIERGNRKTDTDMSHLVDKEFIERANGVLLLSILWGALAACVIGALAFDIGHWIANW